MKVLKYIIAILLVIVLLIIISFVINNIKTNSIMDDYSSIYNNEKYSQSYYIDNIDVFEQKVSCGYAVIEMIAKWNNDDISEQSLFDKYGKVVTSTGKSFEKEMNKLFPEYKTTMYKYLKNTELIDKVYNSLANNNPVPFEWAAKYNDEWTLHYSLITGIDIKNDKIIINNPYGYKEEISIKEFLDGTSFNSYENMPLFFKLGFNFGLFEKNTIFIIEK
ncbi:MAG: hypothetical protein E7159_02660 [Firmicutes bacterium]|nr:hypothetical protein [Bacillota bacterium]